MAESVTPKPISVQPVRLVESELRIASFFTEKLCRLLTEIVTIAVLNESDITITAQRHSRERGNP